ncbi:MAG: elongation factor G [Chloroflexi bacterium]|nr:elongation factor G [Chloroflexota bacterium]
MNAYTSEQLRNVVLLGHSGAGKTMLGEAMLFASGVTNRLGRVEDGNTVSDYDPEEHARTYSISLSMLPVEWAGTRLNVIDTPGYADFIGEVVSGLAAADSALIAVDASSGIEPGAELAWSQAEARGLARFVAVTRMDREHADFQQVLESMRDRFGVKVVPLAIPIGAADNFEGVVHLASGEARMGADATAGDAPDDLADEIEAAREQLIESIAETDDELLELYLEGEELPPDRVAAVLAAAVAAGDVVPVLPVCSVSGVGVRTLMNEVARLLPSPLGREHELVDGSCTTEADGPLVVHVFKTAADPFVGRLTFMKVLSGVLTPNANPYNPDRRNSERLGHLFIQRGKEQIETPQLAAGDIGVAAKLAETMTGDTLLGSDGQGERVPGLPFPEATFRSALHPKTKADVDKLSSALQRLVEQDPTILVARDANTSETVMSTIGDAQANIAAARLEKNYGVEVDVSIPLVPYRETVTTKAKSEYKHKKQTGGHGQYGHVVIEIDPAERGAGFSFEEKVVGGNVPRQFIPAVEKGLMETLPDGPLAHAPIVDVRVTLLDGSSHSVDSSEMAFKLAASQALKQGFLDARPILLEPIVRLVVRVPGDRVGDVMSDLNGRRGQVHGVDTEGDYSVIHGEAPLAEIQRYGPDLRSMTNGRGTFTVAVDRYAEVPVHVQEQVLKELQAAAEA